MPNRIVLKTFEYGKTLQRPQRHLLCVSVSTRETASTIPSGQHQLQRDTAPAVVTPHERTTPRLNNATEATEP